MTARLAVLASGGGTNLQALLDRFNGDPAAPARVELVVASRHRVGALQRAERAGVPSAALSLAINGPDFPRLLLDVLQRHAIDLIILAGYLQLVPGEVVERYRGRILNIHPALLPAFGGKGMYGMRVHQAVIASGARVSGATVHHVDERYDEGSIVAQWPVPVLEGDTPETLAARVLRVEHLLLPAAIEALLAAQPAERAMESFVLADADRPEEAQVRLLNAHRHTT